MDKAPDQMTICNLEVLVMPNGEILCLGKTVGFVKDFGKYLKIRDQKKEGGEK